MLNKQSGDMYNFLTHTWNPLAGECPHKCGYCSTNKLSRYPVIKSKYAGALRIDGKAINDNLGKNKFIFVCAQNDLFAEAVPDEAIVKILTRCHIYDNEYLFQSKNPSRFFWFPFPKRSTFCTTIESDYDVLENSAPPISDRIDGIHAMDKKMVTIEPILNFNLDKFLDIIDYINPFQVNIGADSGNNNLPEPLRTDILKLIDGIKKMPIEVFQKDNLKRLLK